MPSESELRERLHDATAPNDTIDLDAVLRRSRSRRRPRVIVTAVVSSLAVAAIIVPVSLGLSGQFRTASSGSAASGSAASAPELSAPATDSGLAPAAGGATQQAPAEKINLCGGTVAEIPPTPNGLVMTVEPVTASAGDRDIPVTVTLTNSGTSPFQGSTSPFPALTLSRDGVVLWHSNGATPSLAETIDLAPGGTMTFSSSFQPLRCAVSDDQLPSFGNDLPEVGPGSYRITAALEVSSATGGAELVSGPEATVTLR
jgi:hypothetical protein